MLVTGLKYAVTSCIGRQFGRGTDREPVPREFQDILTVGNGLTEP